jgi:hypothetical protein
MCNDNELAMMRQMIAKTPYTTTCVLDQKECTILFEYHSLVRGYQAHNCRGQDRADIKEAEGCCINGAT